MVCFEKVYLYITANGVEMRYATTSTQSPYILIEVTPTTDGVANITGTYEDFTFTFENPDFFNSLMVPGTTLLTKLQTIFLNLSAEKRNEIINSNYLGPTELQKFVNFFTAYSGSTLFLYTLLSKSSSLFSPLVSYLPVEHNTNDLSGATTRLANYYRNVVMATPQSSQNSSSFSNSFPSNSLAKNAFSVTDDFWNVFSTYFTEGPLSENDVAETIYRATLASALIAQSHLEETRSNLNKINNYQEAALVEMNKTLNEMQERFIETTRQSEMRTNRNVGQVLSLVGKTVSFALTGLNDRRNEVMEDIGNLADSTKSNLEEHRDNVERNVSITVNAAKDEITRMNNTISKWNTDTRKHLESLASDIEKKTLHCGMVAASAIYKQLEKKFGLES